MLLVAYGAFGLLTLFRVQRALSDTKEADTAYQYSQVVRNLYRAGVACLEGRPYGEYVELVKERVQFAMESYSFDELTPESKAALTGLVRALERPMACQDYLAWAERIFPVQAEAVDHANWVRAEIKTQLASYRRNLLLGLALLFAFAALILYLLERLRRAQAAEIRALEDESRFKSRLLGLVAHELRTPLAAVAGFAELAARAEDEKTRLRYLKSLETASRRMRAALATFLDLHRLEAGQGIGAEPEPTDLVALAEGALEVARGAHPKVAFRAELPGRPLVARVDKNRVAHAVLNLLENAAKYGEGEVVLRLREAPEEMRFEVESAGHLDPEAADRLFAPFSRLPEHQGIEGWGLGLSLVREVARAHGGEAGLEARGGRLVFYIALPKAQGADSPRAGGVQAG